MGYDFHITRKENWFDDGSEIIAWRALVELSGSARPTALVNEVAQARAQRAGIDTSVAGHSQSPSPATASRRFADLTSEERQDRRNEFRAQLREAVSQLVERSRPLRERVVVQIAQASEKVVLLCNLNELKEPPSKSRTQKYL